jgi:hypothetical protein
VYNAPFSFYNALTNKRNVGVFFMREKIIEILVRLAHISENLKMLSTELDKMYDVLGDNDFLKSIDEQFKK